MSWLQTALQGARQAGSGLTERAKDAGRSIAARTQQLEEVVVNNLQAAAAAASGSPPGARDQEARLEAEAQRLASGGQRQAAHALEVVQRWLGLLRSVPQPRYSDAPSPSDEGYVLVGAEGCAELTFLQLFLRSRALELALRAAAAAPELRASLRDHALASQEPAPEDGPPPAAFARAFVALLRLTVGAPDLWLAPLAALLSSDRGAADEHCVAWLVRLISEQRLGWEGAAAQETERDVEAIEEASRGLAAAAADAAGAASPAGGGAASGIPAALAQRGRAAGEAYRSWGLRRSLADDLGRAAVRERRRAEAAAAAVAAIAADAAEYGAGLDARAAGQSGEAERLRVALGGRREDLQARLESLAPTTQQLRRDIEEAETTQRELLLQVGQLSEKLEQLRRQRAECDKQEERLVAELQGMESTLAQQLASEDQARQQVDTARALASTVADLAGQVGAGFAQAAASGDSPASALAAAAERNRAAALAAAVALADREVERLGDVARAVGACVAVAEERERSREAMAALGVPAFTLESDVVGEANITQSLQCALDELERTPLADLDRLRQELLAADGVPRAADLAAALQERRAELEGARARLVALLELPGESVDGFLQSVGIEADTAIRLGPGSAGGPSVRVPAGDPFLLSGGAAAATGARGPAAGAAPGGAVAGGEAPVAPCAAPAGATASAGGAPTLQPPAASAPAAPNVAGGEAPASASDAPAAAARDGGAPPAVAVEASPAVAAEPPGSEAPASAGAAPAAAAQEGGAPLAASAAPIAATIAAAQAPPVVAAEVPPASAAEASSAPSAAPPAGGGGDGGGLMSYHPPARGSRGEAAPAA